MIAEGYRPNCAVPELEAVLGKPTVRNFRGRLETWVMVGLGTRSIIERVENGNSRPRLRAPVLYPTEERAARYLHDVCMFRRERDRALQERDQARGAEAYWRGIAAVPMGSPTLPPSSSGRWPSPIPTNGAKGNPPWIWPMNSLSPLMPPARSWRGCHDG